MRGQILSPEDARHALSLFAKGYDTTEIALMLGCEEAPVHNSLAAARGQTLPRDLDSRRNASRAPRRLRQRYALRARTDARYVALREQARAYKHHDPAASNRAASILLSKPAPQR